MPSEIKLYNRDCMEAMKEIPDKAFDLAIVDPPYGIGADVANNKNGGKWGYNQYHDSNWDMNIPTKEYFLELFRISKKQIIWGGNYFSNSLPPKMGWIVWDKKQDNFSFSDGELAWTSFDCKLRFFRWSRSATVAVEGDRKHPTQKSIALYKFCLKNYAKDGNSVLDTHLGSGSIAIACYDMGFDLTGFEIDKEYYDAAVKRLENHKKQLTFI